MNRHQNHVRAVTVASIAAIAGSASAQIALNGGASWGG